MSKIEANLCGQCSAIKDSSILKLSNNIENLLLELEVRERSTDWEIDMPAFASEFGQKSGYLC